MWYPIRRRLRRPLWRVVAGGDREPGELGANVESLQKLLARKAVFVDDDIFSKASLAADQVRTIKVLAKFTATSSSQTLSSPPRLGSRFLDRVTEQATMGLYQS